MVLFYKKDKPKTTYNNLKKIFL